jgi:hypothetical protein
MGEADCPYVGLDAFTQRYARYFFGRALDSAVIADNVLTRPITVLYGPSGVGKSSVLNVGLPAALAGERIKPALVTCRDWREAPAADAWLQNEISAAERKPKQPLIVVLDQFEEYFLYRSTQTGDAFQRKLADLLARRDLRAHLLFSLRDDGLHLLDSLRLRLPGVLGNTLELKHLDEDATREAIEGPISVYNKGKNSAKTVRVQDDFIDGLLSSLRGSLVALGQRRSTAPEDVAIELPFLQLTLQRLWGEMLERGERVLDRGLFTGMGGVDGIVEAHVRQKLDALNPGEQRLASDVFHYIVTPSGGKFAYLPEDLAAQASETTRRRIDGVDVRRLLRELAEGDKRLLRQTGQRFELFHDVLARPVLKWRADYLKDAPFGILTEVVTGISFPLRGGGVLFGRLSDRREETPLSESSAGTPVSRNHVLIDKSGEVFDLRSSFGTTINAKPLHFGQRGVFLGSGDIIGLANTAAVVFRTIDDTRSREVLGTGVDKGWGLLIDGSNRRITGLADTTLYLAIDHDGGLIAEVYPLPGAFAVLQAVSRRNRAARVRITALTTEPPLTGVWREDSFNDGEWVLAKDEEHVIRMGRIKDRPPGYSERRHSYSYAESAERGVYRFGDRRFEIIVTPDPDSWVRAG